MGDNKVMNPQRIMFKELYCNPESDTFGNAQQSAIKAGYSKEYAKSITGKGNEWMAEIVRDQEIISIAETNLKNLLVQEDDKKIQADMTKFTLKGLKKEKYSERSELTGADGKDLTVTTINYGDTNTVQLPTEGVSDTIT